MPTPDASAFTTHSRLRSFANQNRSDKKTYSRMYQPMATASGLTDFLPSFTNVYTTVFTQSLPWARISQNVTYINKERIR
jgi:hypothetical protein